MNLPQLSNDVLSLKDGMQLAVAMREAILSGKEFHSIEVERLCCFVIKRVPELCALLEQAEEALLSEDVQTMEGLRCAISIEALAAIKQWKEKSDAIRGLA
jgi:hypothetical protein